MHHNLKIWPVFFERVKDRKKPFEIRKYDRPFDAGDTATLYEWDPTHQAYTGNSIQGNIPFVMAEVMGLKEGYCAFTFDPLVIRTDDFPVEPVKEVAPNAE
jgi:hypothetical protein